MCDHFINQKIGRLIFFVWTSPKNRGSIRPPSPTTHPIFRSFRGWHFPLVSCLRWSLLVTSQKIGGRSNPRPSNVSLKHFHKDHHKDDVNGGFKTPDWHFLSRLKHSFSFIREVGRGSKIERFLGCLVSLTFLDSKGFLWVCANILYQQVCLLSVHDPYYGWLYLWMFQ